ncbi:hypothetical protein CLF_107491 [Clonorchis sinensis]|uniref:FHA domain-containing protein n=1 Tax=Clonorchis sinensis TaxID=79923 RepID=G7YGV9_CLOSI|nr:hypothetical protein CLF_107491 [Clonorchis sinensis]
MSTVTLRWIGDLDQDKREQAGCVSSSSDQYRPKKIELKPGQKEIRIGRINTKNPPDYPIESCINNRMISRNHATIERSARGGSILYDHSMNGTYVNYTRVIGGVTLKHGDIVCFGHLNGANLKPGEKVSLFYSDLKYRVELSDASPSKDTSTKESGSKKRKSHPAQAGSTVSSTQRSDGEDDMSDDSAPDLKRPKSAGTGAMAVAAGRHKSFKKPGTNTSRRKADEDEEDDDLDDDGDDEMDGASVGKRSSSSTKAVKKRTTANGAEKNKKPTHSSSSSVRKSTTGSKLSQPKEKRAKTGKGNKGSGPDGDADASGSEMFHYDTEECSARPCKQPQDIAIDWIQCDKCTLWYHQDVLEAYLDLKLYADKTDDGSPLRSERRPILTSLKTILPTLRSFPLPASPFYRIWHELLAYCRDQPVVPAGRFILSKDQVCFDPVYIPPPCLLDAGPAENGGEAAECLRFSSLFCGTVFRLTLHCVQQGEAAENNKFTLICDPWVDLGDLHTLSGSELSPIADFVQCSIWPVVASVHQLPIHQRTSA